MQNLRSRKRRLILLDYLLDQLDIAVSFLQIANQQFTGKTTPQTADITIFEKIFARRLGELSTTGKEDIVWSVMLTGRRKEE